MRRPLLYSTFVGAIPLTVSEDEIRDLFSRYGLIEQLYITISEKNNCQYGFVRYATPEETIKAVTNLHRYDFKGARLIVDYASDTMDRIKEYKESQTKESKTCKHKSPEVSSRNSQRSKLNGLTFFSVYVGNVPQDISEEEMQDLFGACGQIEHVYHKKGEMFGFIHYSIPEDAAQAVQLLNGTNVRGKIIVVELDNHTAKRFPNELLPSHMEVINLRTAVKESRLNYYSVYFGNIHPDVSKEDIQHIFSTCGAIEDIFMATHEDSRKQYGFIRYPRVECAMKAVETLNDRKIKNKPILVQYAKDTVDRIPKETNSTTSSIGADVKKSLQVKNKSDNATRAPKPKTRAVERLDLFSVYVGHIHPDVSKKEITDLFSTIGHVYDLYIIESSEYKYGFIRFANMKEVRSAITHMNGWKLKDTAIIVDVAHDTVRHLEKACKSRGLMPSVNYDFQLDEKLAARSLEMESVINRSRLHEALSSVRCTMGPMKCPSRCFSRVLDMVDRTRFCHKSFEWKQDLSHESAPSFQDLTDTIKNRTSDLTSKAFMRKFMDVTKTVENLMKEANISPKSNGFTSQKSGSQTAKRGVASSLLSTVGNSNKYQSLKNTESSLKVQTKTDSQRITLSTQAKGRLRSLMVPTKDQSTSSKNNKDLTVFEIGRKLKKERCEGHSLKTNEIHSDVNPVKDDKCQEEAEDTDRGFMFPDIDNRMYQYDEEEGWGDHGSSDEINFAGALESCGKPPHSSWAADLFCKVLDSDCESPPGKSESSSSISSEAGSSGYSSLECGDLNSTQKYKTNNVQEKCLKYKNTTKSELQPVKSQKTDRYLKSALFKLTT